MSTVKLLEDHELSPAAAEGVSGDERGVPSPGCVAKSRFTSRRICVSASGSSGLYTARTCKVASTRKNRPLCIKGFSGSVVGTQVTRISDVNADSSLDVDRSRSQRGSPPFQRFA